jgi:hypothetical protein
MNRRRFVRAMAVAPLLASSAGIAAGAVSHRISPLDSLQNRMIVDRNTFLR